MPIMPILSGLATLAGSSMAMYRCYQDDKQSRYPPNYLMMKDMMKMARKGYPVGMMMPQMMCQMIPYQTQNSMIMNTPYQQPQIAPMPMVYPQQTPQYVPYQNLYQPQQVTNMIPQQQISDMVQQIMQQLQQQQMINQLTQILQQIQSNQQRRNEYTVPPSPPPLVTPTTQSVIPQTNLCITQPPQFVFSTKPMWESSADGFVSYQQPSQPKYSPTVVMNQPMTQSYNPSLIMNQNQRMSWGDANAFSVDTSGLQSFISHLERQNQPSCPSDNYVGNVW